MKGVQLWADKIVDASQNEQPVYSTCFTLDGLHLIATGGTQVLVYDLSGSLVKALVGHKDTATGVSPLLDGGFASGGADKQVIVWNAALQGVLKYSHADSLQFLALNQVTGILLSCSSSDFVLWNPAVRQVNKSRVSSRILCAAWSTDGIHFALGLYNGAVSIRTANGQEKCKIERNAPVWTLAWSPATITGSGSTLVQNTLAVGDWNQKLSFFDASGKPVGKERHLTYDPCSLSYFKEYIVMGGSDKQVHLWNSQGVPIGLICKRAGWVWSCAGHPTQDLVAVGSQDGTIALFRVSFTPAHGLYNDFYAFRSDMTDVVVKHLSNDNSTTIKCRDFIKKISLYKDRLAVQLPDKTLVYELFFDETNVMHYRIKDKIARNFECSLMLTLSMHLVLCHQTTLQMHNFIGELEREWDLEATITYCRVIGGPKGRETILVGLANGQVSKVFIDSPFAIPVVNHGIEIKCLDISLLRKQLAIVDTNDICSVYHLGTKELLFQELNALSVSWNSQMEDMLCISGPEQLSLKVADFPAFQQTESGIVIGFKGTRAFLLDGMKMRSVQVSATYPMERYMEKNDYESAYLVASLGVCDGDWRRLGISALERLNLDVALKCFTRIQDFNALEAIRGIERIKMVNKEPDLVLANVYAFLGNYHEATRLFKRCGNVQKALDMYTELNMWDQATLLASDSSTATESILMKKAETLESQNDSLSAAITYEKLGNILRATDILVSLGETERLIELLRKAKEPHAEALRKCIGYFKKNRKIEYALEALEMLQDIPQLIKMYVELLNWDKAFQIADAHPEFTKDIYLPYGHWLASNDRFDEAQQYYVKAGRADEAIHVLKQLCSISVGQECFEDAAFYYWSLANETRSTVPQHLEENKLSDAQLDLLEQSIDYEQLGEQYFAFARINQYIRDPFTFATPENLMHTAMSLLVKLDHANTPPGISLPYILFTLAKMARTLKCYRLSKFAFDRLLTMHLGPQMREYVELAGLLSRGSPATDNQDMFVPCFQCNGSNPPYTSNDSCLHCKEPFVRCMASFEVLPLVQFILDEGISDKEALELIKQEPRGNKRSTSDEIKNEFLVAERRKGYVPMKLDRIGLLELDASHVFIKRKQHVSIPVGYFKVCDPEARIAQCPGCLNFYGEDEWNIQVLQNGKCAFCRTKVRIESD